MFVTTSFQPTQKQIEEAKALAAKWKVTYVERQQDTLKELFRRLADDEAIIVTKDEWRYQHLNGHRFSFHPNMSALRIKHIKQGHKDPLVTCADLKPGDVVLDCTLGMGADAIVASYAVGSSGKVIALESQPVIAELVKHGLKNYQTKRSELKEAMRRIEVVQADYRHYLKKLPDGFVDVVIFDPMFRETVKASQAMQILKPLANPEPLDKESVQEALRVARRAVLLKERPQSGEFEHLGFTVAKKSSHYAWGIIRKEGLGEAKDISDCGTNCSG